MRKRTRWRLRAFLVRFGMVLGFLWLLQEAGSYFEVTPFVQLSGNPYCFVIFVAVSSTVALVLMWIQQHLLGAMVYAHICIQDFTVRRARELIQSTIEAVRTSQTPDQDLLQRSLAKVASYVSDARSINSATGILTKQERSQLRNVWDRTNALAGRLSARSLDPNDSLCGDLLAQLKILERVESHVDEVRCQEAERLA